ncbi:MAG TPA: fibronectin type III domain-containing protein [Candidatus Acidoferrales bacterium]|jgi:hypothetical protein|nr:fibronectin type III domain-containing protein [Candidatus Acidoferrales bacterium]
MIRRILILTVVVSSPFAVAATNQTASVTLAWTPSVSPSIAGYDVYYGTSSGNYTESVTITNVDEMTIQGLTNGTTYYFAAKTLSSAGALSGFSAQISYVAGITSAIPSTITSQLASPSGQFSFSVSGTSGFEYAVEASTNLANWVILGTNTVPFIFVDTNASQFSQRFYRAVPAPDISVTTTAQATVAAAGQVTSTSVNASGQFSFLVTGTAGDPYAVEASTNMVNWIILATNTAPFNFVDTDTNHFSRRFYRAVPTQYAGITGTATTTTTLSPAPVITSSSVSASGHFYFTVSGATGYQYAVEASTNMVNWTMLQTNAAPFTFIDMNTAKFNRRFYRAVYFPN